MLHEVNAALSARLATEHSRIGYNLAAMRFMAHGFEQRAEGKAHGHALTVSGQELVLLDAQPIGEHIDHRVRPETGVMGVWRERVRSTGNGLCCC